MSVPRYSSYPLMIVLAIASLVLGGCGTDEAGSPVDQYPLDEAPPLAPTGVSLYSQIASKFLLTWTDNSEPDLAGYRVYVYDPSPMRANAFVSLGNGKVLSEASVSMTGEDNRSYIFRVAAVDLSGNEGSWSEPFAFTFQMAAEQPLVDRDPGPLDGWESSLPAGSSNE